MKRVLLLGCGYTLERLARRLPPESVYSVSRSEERAEELKARGLRVTSFDVTDAKRLGHVVDRHGPFHVVIDSIPPPKDKPSAYIGSIVATVGGPVLERLVYLSTTGVFGVDDGSWVDEDTVPHPVHPTSASRLACENAYRRYGIPVTILRLAGIYGPGRGIGNSLKQQTYRLIEGNRWMNRIHVDDIVTTLERICENPGGVPDLLCMADDEPVQIEEVIEYYCSKLNLPAPQRISLEQATRDGLHTQTSNQRVSNRKLKASLLPQLAYPTYREGAGAEFEGMLSEVTER